MPRLTLDTRVHAALETAWQVLVDRAEHPASYDADVIEARVTESLGDGFLQELRSKGMVLKQRVTLDKERGEVRYQILEHPLHTGVLRTRVQPTSVQSPVAPLVLTITFDWTPSGAGEHRLQDTQYRTEVERELVALKHRAEELEKSA
jgi:hypothetical protein